VLRTQYGQAVERLLEQQVKSARKWLDAREPVDKRAFQVPSLQVVFPEAQPDGAWLDDPNAQQDLSLPEPPPAEVEYVLRLPPRVVEHPVIDPTTGEPTGEVTPQYEARRPGAGGDVDVVWGPYFQETEEDKQKKGGTLTASNGGRPLMSHKASVEQWAEVNDLDPTEEWQNVVDEERQRAEQAMGMFPGIDPALGAADPVAPAPLSESAEGAPEETEATPAPAADVQKNLPINRADIAAVITVDEARAMLGQPPWPDPAEGKLTVAEFKERRMALGKGVGEVEADAAAKEFGVALEAEQQAGAPPPPDQGPPGGFRPGG
jgi:hypothetical protein